MFPIQSKSTGWRAAALAFLTAALCAGPLGAQESKAPAGEAKAKAPAPKQKVFASAEDAVRDLIAAAKATDSKALLAVLGAAARSIVQSGDAVADKAGMERFAKAYDEANKLEKVDDRAMVLSVGKDGWPFPIPIVKSDAGWRFDSAAGKEEILNRRIGRNELYVIQVMQAIVDAQREYYLRNPQNDRLLAYAQRFLSTQGKRDGLYFPTKAGEPVSPLGPLVTSARAEGYKGDPGGKPGPFHGYHFRLLKSQGADAKGGAYDYVAQGKMIGGFAVIAWPAQYENSGIMTFMVSHDGVVYEKDLGPDTATAVQKINRFNPDKSWRPVDKKWGQL